MSWLLPSLTVISSPVSVGISQLLRAWTKQKGRGRANMLSTWANPSIFSCLTASEVLVLEPLDSLNSITSFPHSPACRWQIVKLLSVNYWWFCFFDDLANMDRDMTCTVLTFTSESSHPSFRFRSFLLRFYFTVWNM